MKCGIFDIIILLIFFVKINLNRKSTIILVLFNEI